MMRFKVFFLLLFTLFVGVASAQIVPNKHIFMLPSHGDDHLKVRVGSDMVSVAPGKSFRIAFFFDLGSKWYTYSNASSTTNKPTEIVLQLPDGFTIVKSTWSPKFNAENRYTNDFWVVYEVQAPAQLSKDITIKGSAAWQCCDGNICNMNEVVFDLSLKSGKNAKSKLFKIIDGFLK